MIELSQLLTFSLAAFILIVIPGPAVLFVIARSIEQGRLAGIVSVLGVSLGALGHTVAAAFGLSAILATSAVAFSVVKYLGALYLIYLGIQAWRSKGENSAEITITRQPLWTIFRQGVIVNILNPKAALFFLAFLPQFVDPTRGVAWMQVMLLGFIFVAIALVSDSVYALLAGSFGRLLQNNPRLQKRQKQASGAIYIALGLTAAFSGSNGK